MLNNYPDEEDEHGPFCVVCGDCLKCYAGDPCNGEEGLYHTWPGPLDE